MRVSDKYYSHFCLAVENGKRAVLTGCRHATGVVVRGKLCGEGLAAEDFERFEREVLAGELEALDIDRPCLLIAGRRHHRVLRSSETYTSAAGPLTVIRSLYRAGRGRSVVPLELRAGIVAKH